MRKASIVVVILIASTFAQGALADCTFNGKTYREGEKLGNLTCTSGVWK